MIGFALLLLALASDGVIARHDGFAVRRLLAAYLVFIVRQSRRATRCRKRPPSCRVLRPESLGRPLGDRSLFVVAGLGLLALGAHWLVEAAVAFARHLGMSELLIGSDHRRHRHLVSGNRDVL